MASLTGAGQVALAGQVETNRAPSAVAVNLFFGIGADDEAARKVREMTGVTPYKPGQAQSIEEVRQRAIEAIKKEGRPIDGAYTCAANIEMSTGSCAILLSKVRAPHYQVLFNAAGEITSVGGATGPHGEQGWSREYIRGKPGGAANRSQPVRPGTNQPSAAAGSGR